MELVGSYLTFLLKCEVDPAPWIEPVPCHDSDCSPK
jgi:hypothetical protein